MIKNIFESNLPDASLNIGFSGRFITAETLPDELSPVPADYLRWEMEHRHRHEFREIVVVISGESIFQLNGHYFHVHPGDIVLFDSMDMHTDGHYPGDGGIYWWLDLWTDMLRILLWRGSRIETVCYQPVGSFNDLFYQIWCDLDTPNGAQAKQELQCIIFAIMNHHLRNYCSKSIPYTRPRKNQLMENIVRHIEKMPSLNCTLDSLAQLAGYSKVHFQRIFMEYTGLQFRDYLLRKRVERYRRLAEKGHCSLKEMADQLGFASVSALLHWKKRNKEPFHLK